MVPFGDGARTRRSIVSSHQPEDGAHPVCHMRSAASSTKGEGEIDGLYNILRSCIALEESCQIRGLH